MAKKAFQAIQTFVAARDPDEPADVVVSEGAIIFEGDRLLRRHPDQFRPVGEVANVVVPLEQATAGPGEKRTVTRRRPAPDGGEEGGG